LSLSRNSLYNLGLGVGTLAVSLVTVPVYLRTIGEARYGILTIVWLLLGYFGAFELGTSRATASFVARRPEERGRIFIHAFVLNLGAGVLGALLLTVLFPLLVGHVFLLTSRERHDLLAALPLVALAVPATTLGFMLSGTLEGRERFLLLNGIQFTTNVLLQSAPLAVALLVGPRLVLMIASVVVARLLMLVPLAWAAILAARPLPRLGFEKDWFRRLFGYGGWVTLTGLVTPVMDFLDRFAIATLLGPAAVAEYVVPFNLAARTRIFPASVTRALFPRLSALDPEEARALALRTLRHLVALLTPLLLLALLLVTPFLRWWIDERFASEAAPLGRILLVGAWAAGLALVGYVAHQAAGRPERVAWIRCGEAPLFLGALWWALTRFGLPGAACAWTGWSLLDAALLLGTSGLLKKVWPTVFTGLALMVVALAQSDGAGPRSAVGAPLLVALVLALLLEKDELRTYRQRKALRERG